MDITIVPNDMDAPGFYRVLSPGRQLAENGHRVSMPPHTQELSADGSVLTTFTIDPKNITGDLWVLQQRKERVWAEGMVNTLRNAGVATVADVDDNYLETPAWNPAFEGLHPYRTGNRIRNRAERRQIGKQNGDMSLAKVTNGYNRDHLHEVLKQVELVTVSTPYLKELYSRLNENVTVIRNYLDWEMWEDVQPQYDVQRWGNRIRVGYLGVFKYRKGDLAVLRDVIAPFLARHPEVDFVANSHLVHDYLAVPKRQRVVVKEFHFFPRDGGTYPLPRKTAVLDVGLVPLAPGGFNEGKSHLKGMEYNAVGAPYLCSDTESYRYYTDEGENGVTCHTASDWTEKLEFMVANDYERRRMGASARAKASIWTIQNRWQEYASAYEALVSDKLTAICRGAVTRGAVQKISELRHLLEYASTRDLRTVVEVGSAAGGTFWALAQVANEDALMISIDIPSGSPIDVREGKDVYAARKGREIFRTYCKETQRCVTIDGNSQSMDTVNKLADTLGTRKIDFLLIDADHRLPGVTRDYVLYAPFVREGGIIAFHDVIPQNDKRSGVHVLWQQIRKKTPNAQTWVGKDNWGLGQWGGIGAFTVEGKLPRVGR